MFGYVIPDRAALSPEAQSRYRSAYCGLCRRIDALHGLRGRFSLSYDLTFLNILLCSLYEGETPADSGINRCPIHPVHGVLWRSADPTDYCADLSVALHYYNAQDKWQDDRNLLALGPCWTTAPPKPPCAGRASAMRSARVSPSLPSTKPPAAPIWMQCPAASAP